MRGEPGIHLQVGPGERVICLEERAEVLAVGGSTERGKEKSKVNKSKYLEYSQFKVYRIRRRQRLGRKMGKVEEEWGRDSVSKWPSLTSYDAKPFDRHIRKRQFTPSQLRNKKLSSSRID